jgi:hypothetical protein
MKIRKTFDVRALSVVLSLLMVLSVIAFPTMKAKAEEPGKTLDDFVERCYTVTLDRPSDAPGFADWKDQLLNGRAVGVEIAYGFLFSKEYTAKNKSNEDYVTDLYMLFMGRTPDEEGYKDWVGQLNNGKSRLEVYAGFANSLEFYNLCTEYGITAGRYVPGYDRTTINNVNLFVERLYKTCLGRIGDREGQKNWVEKLITKQISGTECARSFIQSTEYVNKGLYDDNYVKNLYLAMMGRPYDEEGFYNWINALSNGMTRDEVFAGFANSAEFANLCAKYNIDKGSYTAKDVSKPSETPETTETKNYRISRKDFNNGDYVLVKYGGGNWEIAEKRYDKNGNDLGYDYRQETSEDGLEEFLCHRDYWRGSLSYEYHTKKVYNSDHTQCTEYEYSDEWLSETFKRVFKYKKVTVNDGDYSYDTYLQTEGTFYNMDGSVAGSIKRYYDSANRENKTEQFFPDGTLYWYNEREYYGNKDYTTKKEIDISYRYDGSIEQKHINEYNEKGIIVKSYQYYDDTLDYLMVTELDSKGNMTKTTYYDDSNNIKYYYVYENDIYGNRVKTTEFLAPGVVASYTYDTYDANNNWISSKTTDSNNNILSESKYEYDSKGNLTYSYYNNGTDTEEYVYEYDENYNQTKYTYKENGSVVYWEKRSYEEY